MAWNVSIVVVCMYLNHTHSPCPGGMQVYELLSYAKVFHVRNSGPTPFTIKKSSIDGLGCDGNGFRITNCDKPLIVYPNRTRKIEVM